MYLASHESVFTLDSWIERVCQLFDWPAPPVLDSSQDEISGLPKRPLNMHACEQTDADVNRERTWFRAQFSGTLQTLRSQHGSAASLAKLASYAKTSVCGERLLQRAFLRELLLELVVGILPQSFR